jgi:SARP family transcriptional regulator, regulator of embCAB operon
MSETREILRRGRGPLRTRSHQRALRRTERKRPNPRIMLDAAAAIVIMGSLAFLRALPRAEQPLVTNEPVGNGKIAYLDHQQIQVIEPDGSLEVAWHVARQRPALASVWGLMLRCRATGACDRGGRFPMTGRDPKQPRTHLRVSVLGGFRLEEDGVSVLLPDGSKRLLAFLALNGRSIRRSEAAGTLWPAVTEDHASSSLRSALARLSPRARESVLATTKEIGLSHDVAVDLWDSRELAHLLTTASRASPAFEPDVDDVVDLSNEILPGWYDDWVLVEAEAWRQVRLHALEALADSLSERQQYAEAAAAALAAVKAEPLRESPRAALIRVHIAEGNPSEALREFARYGELLQLELGIEPTERLRALVDGLLPVAAR